MRRITFRRTGPHIARATPNRHICVTAAWWLTWHTPA